MRTPFTKVLRRIAEKLQELPAKRKALDEVNDLSPDPVLHRSGKFQNRMQQLEAKKDKTFFENLENKYIATLVYLNTHRVKFLAASIGLAMMTGITVFLTSRKDSEPTVEYTPPVSRPYMPPANDAPDHPYNNDDFVNDALNNPNLRKAMDMGEESFAPGSGVSENYQEKAKEFDRMMKRWGVDTEKNIEQKERNRASQKRQTSSPKGP